MVEWVAIGIVIAAGVFAAVVFAAVVFWWVTCRHAVTIDRQCMFCRRRNIDYKEKE